MDAVQQIAFATCRLDLRTRELRLDGVVQAVEPKIFDLIVLLVDRRHRVVTKDELLKALWPGRVVSDGAIARTVMRARQVIGQAALIKTIHRVGYRFAGRLDSPIDAPPTLVASTGTGTTAGLRIAVLPLDNHTGDRRLEWTELGLAALVVQQLGSDGRLGAVGLTELLMAVAPLPSGTPVGERVAAATALLGLHGCVHGALRRQGATLWLDYQGYGERLNALAGSLCGDEPADLAQRLAAEVRAVLALDATHNDGAFTSQDPFVRQAFARAGQMLALHQFRVAAKLLDMVIEFEADSLPARLAHVRALANLGDPATHEQVDTLVRMAATRSDTRVQAQALSASAHVHTMSDAPHALVAATDALDRAMRLAAPFGHEDWAVRLQLSSARTAMLRGDAARARALYDAVEAASTDVNNQFQLALTLDQRAWMERECGEWLKAHGLLERALHIYQTHKLPTMAALTRMDLAFTCTELGLMQRAHDHARQSEALLASVQQPYAMVTIAESAARAGLAHRALGDIDRVLALLAPPQGRVADSPSAAWLAALGLRAQCAGDVDTARQHLLRALDLGEGMQSPVRRANRLRQWVALEIEAFDAAAVAEPRLAQPTPLLAAAQQRAQAFLAEHDDGDLRALLSRSMAAQCLLQGDRVAALAHLQHAVAAASAGRVQALSRLDAAWLLLVVGKVADARATVRGIGPWMDEHALGQALAARLANSVVDTAEAVDAAGATAVDGRRLPSLRWQLRN